MAKKRIDEAFLERHAKEILSSIYAMKKMRQALKNRSKLRKKPSK